MTVEKRSNGVQISAVIARTHSRRGPVPRGRQCGDAISWRCNMKRLILALLAGAALAASSPAYAAVKTIVLVHGAFADGSGWKPVADILQSHGYSVLVVQEPETSFAADVAATRRVLDKAGPCVLVGHSYGGMIATETGMHPDVKALVYVAAVQPDVGESVASLSDKMPAAAKSVGPVG